VLVPPQFRNVSMKRDEPGRLSVGIGYHRRAHIGPEESAVLSTPERGTFPCTGPPQGIHVSDPLGSRSLRVREYEVNDSVSERLLCAVPEQRFSTLVPERHLVFVIQRHDRFAKAIQ